MELPLRSETLQRPCFSHTEVAGNEDNEQGLPTRCSNLLCRPPPAIAQCIFAAVLQRACRAVRVSLATKHLGSKGASQTSLIECRDILLGTYWMALEADLAERDHLVVQLVQICKFVKPHSC